MNKSRRKIKPRNSSDKIKDFVKSIKIMEVKSILESGNIKPEWDDIGMDEFKECFFPEITMELDGKTSVHKLKQFTIKTPINEVNLHAAVEILDSICISNKISIRMLVEDSIRTPLTRLINDIYMAHENNMVAIRKDLTTFDQMVSILHHKKKNALIREIKSVFRRSVHHVKVEEINEMWNLAQVEMIMES